MLNLVKTKSGNTINFPVNRIGVFYNRAARVLRGTYVKYNKK